MRGRKFVSPEPMPQGTLNYSNKRCSQGISLVMKFVVLTSYICARLLGEVM